MDLLTVTDVKELKVLLADAYTQRENARAVEQQTSQNIQLINQRLAQIAEEEKEVAVDEAPKKAKK